MNSRLLIESTTQLAVFLSNRPGALARVCDALAKADINIHALATSDTIDHSVVRMVVSDPTKALMLLGESGVLALENDVLMIESANSPGTLARIAERLSKANVNIEYAYMAASPKSDKAILIVRPSDVEKAHRALHDLSKHRPGPVRTADIIRATFTGVAAEQQFTAETLQCDPGDIRPTMECANPALSVRQTMDHNVGAGGNAVGNGARRIFRGRIGNVQAEMKAALRVATIDLVNPFRRF